MTPDTYTSLLKDLQRLEKRITDAFVGRARASAALGARLSARHAEAEVGGRVEDFVTMCARKSAVQFLLRTVYVRVLEDLGALSPARIRGERGLSAFRDVAPGLGVRSYLRFVFEELARDFPNLFTAGPDELGELPGEDLCREVWDLWHHPKVSSVPGGPADTPYGWATEGDAPAAGELTFSSRFLGDLYQDLDAEVRKRYALLQTPDFVERYILDHTLTPALAEFGLESAGRQAGGVSNLRVLDPTCGSGHFLIGAFHRLADAWVEKGLDRRAAAERALEGVWGCDINPHAVDIAQFRLLLELMAYTGETSLEALGDVSERLHLQVLDSLVPWERGGAKDEQGDLFEAKDRLSKYATPAERAANAAFLAGGFHVVVGNPPYITPKDAQKRRDYQAFWPDSCFKSYAMSAPFAERFFDLGVPGAFVGQITANSFMKREFGKKLVEKALPRVELTRVVDTSGAYIPGHGTPTVILFGRNRTPPRNGTLWAVLGKRGEPKRPAVPAEGLVWSAIARSGDEADDTSPFVTVAAVEREVFRRHPWSLGGGMAGDISKTLKDHATEPLTERLGVGIGFGCITGEDDLYGGEQDVWRRSRVAPGFLYPFVEGDQVRDFEIADGRVAALPTHDLAEQCVGADELGTLEQELWPFREGLAQRIVSGSNTMRDAGKSWYDARRISRDKFRTPLSIAFAFVSTHNHFVLDRGGKVFNRTAPVIKLPATASEDDHLDLLGLLNSSTLGFWMKQVFQGKGNGGIGGGIGDEDWEPRFEYDSTKLQSAPLTTADRTPRVALAAALDATARERAACLPAAVLRAGDFTPDSLPAALAAARDRYRALTHRLVSLQEELDWLTYASYGLLDPPVTTIAPEAVEPLAPGHRPFEIRFARLDDEAEPDEKSAWWSRHGHDRVTEIPEHYGEAHRARLSERLSRIDEDPRLQLLETAAFKRRWQTPDLDAEARSAAERWLLDSLEDLFAPADSPSPTQHVSRGRLAAPRPYRLEAIVTEWLRDARVAAVCGVFSGEGSHVDPTLVAERLLRGHGLPDNPQRLYTAEGLLKRAAWKQTWALQDLEDAQQPLPEALAPGGRIPLPPKYDKGDFQGDAFSTRGKLDVPRERFIRFEDLPARAYGWNGWRDRERAIAQAEAYALAELDAERPLPEPTPEDPRRCGATLGLWESLGDLKRWGDAETHAELTALAREACHQSVCPCPLVTAWQAWRKGTLVIDAERERLEAPVDVTERARLLAVWPSDLGGPLPEVLPVDLARSWVAAGGEAERFERVLESLLAEGELMSKGRGKARRIVKGTAK